MDEKDLVLTNRRSADRKSHFRFELLQFLSKQRIDLPDLNIDEIDNIFLEVLALNNATRLLK